MESTQCIFCNTNKNPVVIKENGYSGKKCVLCNLIYISPRPPRHAIATLYTHNTAHVSAQTHITQELSKRLQAQHHLSIIKNYCLKGALLEIGAGAGYFLDEAQKHGFTPYGIEPNSIQASFIQQTFGFICETNLLSSTSFGSTLFDVIYHCDVTSHFYDPQETFSYMHTKLAPQGILCFETGNIGDIDQKYYRWFNRFQYPDHLFFFSKSSIDLLLHKTGFKLIACYRYSIGPQLFLHHIMRKLFKKPHNNNHHSDNHYAMPRDTSFLSRGVRYLYTHMQHMLRYTVGKYTIKNHHPQTILFIVGKK